MQGCGDIVVCDLLETREDTVGRREALCCGAGSRRTDSGDFLVKETVEIPGADVVATGYLVIDLAQVACRWTATFALAWTAVP